VNINAVDRYVHILNDFFENIADDPCISPTHISLYMALFQEWSQCGFINPMEIARERIMKRSKISGTATYFRCINNLHELGYIDYRPAGHRYMKSSICISHQR
jgi:hypothetical protein